MKNFTLSIKEEFAPYGIYVQLVTPMYVRTKMNNYSTTVSAGGILVPDVESYTKSAVFSIGRTSETTGYWSHGIQVKPAIHFIPIWIMHSIKINHLLISSVRCHQTRSYMGQNDVRQETKRKIPRGIFHSKSSGKRNHQCTKIVITIHIILYIYTYIRRCCWNIDHNPYRFGERSCAKNRSRFGPSSALCNNSF